MKSVAPYSNDTVGVIDIGNLNINGTCWTMRELDRQYSLTDELGGNIFISGLSQELSAAFSRYDDGFLRVMCSKILNKVIELPDIE